MQQIYVRGLAVDTLSSLIYAVIAVVLAAPIIEIAVKRPRIFLEMNEGAEAFAEAPVPANDTTGSRTGRRALKVLPVEQERLAA
jgi:hypothetical protein